ncbi:MAG TPA: alpha/beta hydrolase [Solirubrobacteraceae bacterium]|nr:alpha/beta hydrolase [Solirubrobacteraceae bacterium]
MPEITTHHGALHSTKLHVEDTGGSGRPVVLIHAWPLSGAAWAAQVPALTEAGYRVITYDRRGFGRSDKPRRGYDYDTLTEDLHTLITELALSGATLVGHSMGGGEVARYMSRYGGARVHSVVFAAAVTPYLLKSAENPDGPLTEEQAQEYTHQAETNLSGFLDEFITGFFSVDGVLKVPEGERHAARALAAEADEQAILSSMKSWATTDFRGDLPAVDVPALILHGDSDASVPYEGSGRRTHEAISGSEAVLLHGAPHGCNITHTGEFNQALLDFLAK